MNEEKLIIDCHYYYVWDYMTLLNLLQVNSSFFECFRFLYRQAHHEFLFLFPFSSN